MRLIPWLALTALAGRLEAQTFIIDTALPVAQPVSLVAWGDADGDGRMDLFMTTTVTGWEFVGTLFRSETTGLFVPTEPGLLGVNEGGVAWGDYDRDGDLDLLMAGFHLPGPPFIISRIYQNDGHGSFTDLEAGLQPMLSGGCAWVDADNDGDLDVFITGATSSYAPEMQLMPLLYSNVDGKFVLASTTLPALQVTAFAWGDYDRDGDQDVVLIRPDASHLYRNEGAGSFTALDVGLPSTLAAKVAWADLDSDGWLDLVVVGQRLLRAFLNGHNAEFHAFDIGSQQIASPSLTPSFACGDFDQDGDIDLFVSSTEDTDAVWVMRNDGPATFTEIRLELAAAAGRSSGGETAAGDYDADGDLDVVTIGSDLTWSYRAYLYQNTAATPKPPPPAPVGPSASLIKGNDVQLSWERPGSDSLGSGEALRYNLRIGRTPGGIDVMAPHADPPTGRRQIPDFGNAGAQTGWRLIDLPKGTYFWSVQTIGANLAASAFAPEASFAVTNARPVLSMIGPQVAFPDRSSAPIAFTVSDIETRRPISC